MRDINHHERVMMSLDSGNATLFTNDQLVSCGKPEHAHRVREHVRFSYYTDTNDSHELEFLHVGIEFNPDTGEHRYFVSVEDDSFVGENVKCLFVGSYEELLAKFGKEQNND